MAYALITGASGGIGLALARELAARKHDLLLIARSGQTLEKLASDIRQQYRVKVDILAMDLAAPNAAQAVFNWLQSSNYSVDILVNNAGFGSWGLYEEIPESEFQGMMQLNMVTLANLCRLLLPMLKKQEKAYILNVSSTAAYQAVPTLSLYAATKAFVLVLTRGLNWELQGTSVSASCLSPGPTTTGFIDRANLGRIKDRAEKFSMSAEAVANIAIKGMLAGKPEIIPGLTNWLSAKLAEIVPKGIPERIARNLYK
ncbi:MAG: SDR family oxidoreductase [Cyclobacteriaceae bacterium]|nr:SDR family oxidoreductase [Cyclobacteriaceae bacterium]